MGITVNPPNPEVAAGGTLQFTADVMGLAWEKVNWFASGGAINSSGLFTAGDALGTFSVTAVSGQNSSIIGSTSVTVFDAAP